MKYEIRDKFPIMTRTAIYVLNTFMAITLMLSIIWICHFSMQQVKKFNANF